MHSKISVEWSMFCYITRSNSKDSKLQGLYRRFLVHFFLGKPVKILDIKTDYCGRQLTGLHYCLKVLYYPT